MNEKLQYASMLEIPVNTCNITLTPAKKGRRKKKRREESEGVKQELIEKINQKNQEMTIPEQDGLESLVDQPLENPESPENSASVHAVENKKEKKPHGFSIISAQVAVIGLLIVSIILTNYLYADSGINVFFREVFGAEQTVSVDQREYDDFLPVLSMGDAEVTLTDGIMSFSGAGSVYSPCDGVVSAITQTEDGKYTVEITHSTNFKSIISGIDYAYAGLEQKVYGNIPVGFVRDGVTACFKNQDDAVISDYQIVDGGIVWSV